MGFGKSKGSKGKGAGQWMFVPTAVVKGKSSGKGKTTGSNVVKKSVKRVDAALKVWVANVGTDVKAHDLEKHMKKAGKVTAVEMKKEAAGVAYATAKDAKKAIEKLTGTTLKDDVIEVTRWYTKATFDDE